ncbi:MAG: class I SAM-dependent methyltransferase [Paludibaculum sp.]
MSPDCFREYFPDWNGSHVVDLGCGPGDIPIRFLRAYPDARLTAVDASHPMLDLAAEAIAGAGLTDYITLCCERFQSLALPEQADALLSNSLLHHVPNPLQFWFRLKGSSKAGCQHFGHGSPAARIS